MWLRVLGFKGVRVWYCHLCWARIDLAPVSPKCRPRQRLYPEDLAFALIGITKYLFNPISRCGIIKTCRKYVAFLYTSKDLIAFPALLTRR